MAWTRACELRHYAALRDHLNSGTDGDGRRASCRAFGLLRPDPSVRNKNEIAYTLELYPEARDYLDVYQRHGLLSDKMLLGHSIHLEQREIDTLAETGARPVFCPTSNLFLGSGLFDDAGLRSKGIVNAIATDIGAGTSYSMLQTLNEGYKILQLRGPELHPFRAFHWITRGNAVALGLEDKIGTLDEGTEADIVVLDSRATEAMALRMERASTLAEELFVLQMLGDDRAIDEVYVAGKPQKGKAPAVPQPAPARTRKRLLPEKGPRPDLTCEPGRKLRSHPGRASRDPG